MDSSQNASSPYFKSLEYLQPSEPNPTNGNPNIPKGITFYQSVLLKNRVILFGRVKDLTKNSQSLWTFDLETLKWSITEVKGSSVLVENQDDYSLCLTQDNHIVLFGTIPKKNQPNGQAPGVFGGARAAPTGGLFGGAPANQPTTTPTQPKSQAYVERLLTAGSDGMKWVQDQNQGFVPLCTNHSANTYGDKMYVFGGLNPDSGKATNDLYEYSLGTKHWKQIHVNQTKPDERYNHKTSIYQGNIFLYGGDQSSDKHFDDLWVFNLRTFSWKIFTPKITLSYRIKGLALVSVSSQTLLMFGTDQGYNEVYSFKTDSNTWNDIGVENLPIALQACSIFHYKERFIIQNKLDFYQLSLDLEKIEDKISENSTFIQQMKNLLNENTYCDFKFKVEGKEIPGIKAILAARCPYFVKMFSSGMKESQSEIIDVPDINYEVYYKLINYLYCDQIEFNEETAIGLLKLSEEYSLPALKTKCAKYLARIVDHENFMDLAGLAEQYQAEELEKSILSYFVAFKTLILQSHSIRDLPRYVLEEYALNSL